MKSTFRFWAGSLALLLLSWAGVRGQTNATTAPINPSKPATIGFQSGPAIGSWTQETTGPQIGAETMRRVAVEEPKKQKNPIPSAIDIIEAQPRPGLDDEAPPPHGPPIFNLPPGATMGGLPPDPVPLPHVDDPTFLEEIRKNLTIRLREGGGTLRVYGFMRGDFDFATNKFNDIQNPFYVLSPSGTNGVNKVPNNTNDSNYSLYARLTRLGFEYYGSPIQAFDGAVVSGRLEVDWLTSTPSNPETRELLRLRLAYAQLVYKELTIVAGQDWDIIAPLLPTINDNTLMWNAGNMGDRRTQLKILWDHKLENGWTLQLQNGAVIGDGVTGNDLDANGTRDQEDFGLPIYEGRVGLIIPSAVEKQPIMGGAWWLYGMSNTNVPIKTRSRFVTEAIGFDIRFPITNKLFFQSEGYFGKDLDDFRGGIGQGVNISNGKEIWTKGGWAEFIYQTCKYHQIAVGSSVDNPQSSDLSIGGRTLNRTWYVSNRFPVGSGFVFGLDYVNWSTQYLDQATGNASLIKAFMQMNF